MMSIDMVFGDWDNLCWIDVRVIYQVKIIIRV